MTDPSELLPLLPKEGVSRSPRREPDVPERFRRFVIDEQHTVFVGRSDKDNDFLTHRFASPNDLWFHAQGSAGSHVILKGAHRSTPGAVIEKAASIAAYFSKARHSRTVPVVYTEKRHVRKPRKAKPGTALCTHEKTLFVSPAIPEEKKSR
jgi:predicted ribosome quality control (RQC) complex YloA/Tae2 family protein